MVWHDYFPAANVYGIDVVIPEYMTSAAASMPRVHLIKDSSANVASFHFAPESMDVISGGSVRTFKPDGIEGRTDHFGRQNALGLVLGRRKLHYARVDEPRAEMIQMLDSRRRAP